MTDTDPTAIDIDFDPLTQRMVGYAYHGNTPFDVPFISHITENLYQGGCQEGLILPAHIEHVISLYIWESYVINHELKTFRAIKMYDDSDEPNFDHVVALATLVKDCMEDGPTLVHCQAGLNRSSLVAATALWLAGMKGEDALALLKEKRSPAVLCNQTFANWINGLDNRDRPTY